MFEAVILLLACVNSAFGLTLPKMNSVRYAEMGFKIDIPANSQKIAISSKTDSPYDVYIYNGLIYMVKIIKTPKNSLTSTAIEQRIQADCKKTNAKRWELETKRGDLFKGTKGLYQIDADLLAKVPQAVSIIGSKTAFQTISISPLKDEASPMLFVGVIGPNKKAVEVEDMAKFMASTVVTNIAYKPAEKAAVRPKTETPSRIKIEEIKKTAKPTIAKKQISQTAPITTQAVKKGDIRIEGEITSVWSNGMGLVLNADKIILPGKPAIKLSPARPKTVMTDNSQEWIKAGLRAIVTGKNDGVGQPIHADTIEQAK